MKTISPPPAPAKLNDEVIRDYAYHLYEQNSCAPGHDLDNWLEATACLNANIPTNRSGTRLHWHVNGLETIHSAPYSSR